MGVLGADFAPAIAGIAPQCHDCRAGTTAEDSDLAGSAGEASCVAYLCAVCGAEFRDLDGLRAHLHAVHLRNLSPTARAAEARAPRVGVRMVRRRRGAFLFLTRGQDDLSNAPKKPRSRTPGGCAAHRARRPRGRQGRCR